MSTQTTWRTGHPSRPVLLGRTGEKRRALRHAQCAALRVLLPALVLMTLASCAPFPPPPPPRPTATTFNCATALQCRVVLPPCGPDLTPLQSPSGTWYGNMPFPHNTASLVGFQPLLPTWIPDGASWYKAVLVGPVSGSGQAALFHAGYGAWPPRENSALRGLDSASVLTIDEATGQLNPLSYLIGDNQVVQIQSQRAVTVAGQPMTVYHLVYPLSSILHDPFLAIEVLWRAGPLTLRVLGIPGLLGAPLDFFSSIPRQGAFDAIDPWTGVAGAAQTGDDDGVLLRLAASVAPYTGCG